MLAAAETGHALTQKSYDTALPKLRTRLLQAHFALRSRKFPVIIIVSGADGAGKGELVHRLNEWLDPRGVATHAFWDSSDEERERPTYWRFWRALPGHGRIGILFGSWYTEPIIRRVYGKIKGRRFEGALNRIVAFENMLTADGALIIKLWLHLPKAAQKKRLKKLEQAGRLAPNDWKHYKLYDRFTKASERALSHTHTATAPWHVIEATDRRYRELAVGKILLAELARRLKQKETVAPPAVSTPIRPQKMAGSWLATVNLRRQLTDAAYAKGLESAQAKLSKLAWAMYGKKRSMVLVFEGWDAAGKGSAIRRVTSAMDPRLYRVVGIAAPTDEERVQHYLWRFWRHLPRAGVSTLFDRSWYGRVLVERVEGFAPAADWGRAYGEIVDFEDQMADHGIIVNKFWVHISPQEQLRRFEERQRIDYKQYKITEEDWRNRKKWPDYAVAVDDMVARTHTDFAPWTLVAGNDKKFARVQIVQTLVRRLEAEL